MEVAVMVAAFKISFPENKHRNEKRAIIND
jgi:hypothetical protein